jgi:hypothetical protein
MLLGYPVEKQTAPSLYLATVMPEKLVRRLGHAGGSIPLSLPQ